MNVQDILTFVATVIEVAALSLVAVGVQATALKSPAPAPSFPVQPQSTAQATPPIAPSVPTEVIADSAPTKPTAPIAPPAVLPTAPSPVTPIVASGTLCAAQSIHPFTVRELRAIAPKLDIKGAAKLNRSTLNRITQSRLTALALA